jgi:hypothetical protein
LSLRFLGMASPRPKMMRLMRLMAAAALALVVLGPSSARAFDLFEQYPESERRPRNWLLEVKLSTVYYPDADSGVTPIPVVNYGSVTSPSLAGPVGPFHAVMNPHHRVLSQLELDRTLWQGSFGTLAVGLGLAYAEFYGHTYRDPGGGAPPVLTTDTTYFREIQWRALLIYRLDPWPRIPIVPYVKGGMDWIYYWSQLSNGSTSTADGVSGDGLTTGLEITLGVAIQLDALDGDISQDAYNTLGISHTYFVFDWTDQFIQNGPGNLIHQIFNGGQSAPAAVNLSSTYFSFGLQFQF